MKLSLTAEAEADLASHHEWIASVALTGLDEGWDLAMSLVTPQ